MIDSAATRQAFTLIEVVSTLLLIAIGITAVLGMSRLGVRWSGEALASSTGMATAFTALVDAQPGGRTADPSDADGDGWNLESGSLTIATTGSYTFTISGMLNGYYVRRTETSQIADIINGHDRFADVSVDVYWGIEGHYVTGLKRRILRHQ